MTFQDVFSWIFGTSLQFQVLLNLETQKIIKMFPW